jgi:NADPH:quinone reductase-like Zn-dependent oxidoreductase
LSILQGCKKETESNHSIIGKWNLKTFREKIINRGTNVVASDSTANYTANSYADFRTDGKIYFYGSIPSWGMNGNYDTSYYFLNGNTIKTISSNLRDTNNLVIEVLNQNELKFKNTKTYTFQTVEFYTAATR